jgi:hypothetical protein
MRDVIINNGGSRPRKPAPKKGEKDKKVKVNDMDAGWSPDKPWTILGGFKRR